jgi:hypoxanthine phosphoribosyltransferase
MQEITKIDYVTKEKADKMVLKLSKKIKLDKLNLDYIVGIERGGINVSKPLSELLQVPHKSIKISFYKDKAMFAAAEPEVDLHGHVFNHKDKVLVVDDLIDNGHTLKYFQEKFNCNSKIAVLYWNKYGKYSIVPDYFIEEKFIGTWLEFYWEAR